MSQPRPCVLPAANATLKPVAHARRARMAVLVGMESGAERFVTRRFLLGPGGRIPEHLHPDIEHEQVVVRGEMLLGLDGREFRVRTGDAVFIPPGTTHWYENRGTEEVEFICVIPRTDRYETQWLEDPPQDIV